MWDHDAGEGGSHIQREKRIRQAIETLTEARRAEMAMLILAGYKFVLGRIYWYCDTPQGGRCSTLDALHDCIRAALAHHTEVELDNQLSRVGRI